MRHVRLFQGGDLLWRQLQRQRRHRVLQMMRLGGPHNRRRHYRLVQQPCQGNLCPRHPTLLRNLAHALHNLAVGILRRDVQLLSILIGLEAVGALVPGARQPAAGQRAPRHDGNALRGAQWQHLALLLAMQQVVVVLHGDEARPAMPVGQIQRLRELPREHGRRADVARLARLHHIVQRFQRDLDRRVAVPAMDLVEVDVVHAQPPQAGVNARHDRLTRQAARVQPLAQREENLGGDDHFVAVGEVADGAAQDFLAVAVGIGVGGVEEVDAQLQRALDKWTRLLFRQRPGVGTAIGIAIGHAAQADARYFHSRASESCVVHNDCLCGAVVSGAICFAVPKPKPKSAKCSMGWGRLRCVAMITQRRRPPPQSGRRSHQARSSKHVSA